MFIVLSFHWTSIEHAAYMFQCYKPFYRWFIQSSMSSFNSNMTVCARKNNTGHAGLWEKKCMFSTGSSWSTLCCSDVIQVGLGGLAMAVVLTHFSNFSWQSNWEATGNLSPVHGKTLNPIGPVLFSWAEIWLDVSFLLTIMTSEFLEFDIESKKAQ